ncbi:MAG: hypothetical protein ACOC8R_00445 [Desulfosalsimonas sp.]
MDISKLNIALRPRSQFEGVDLGFAAASRWFLILWLLWLATAAPVIVLIHGLCFSRPNVALLLVWWVKPLFETPLLYWLSRKIFNEEPEVKTIFKRIPAIVRPRILSRLTWRRLSPARSFLMPVIFLEGLHGKDYNKRAAVLGSNQSAGYALTFICFLFEWVVAISVVFLIQFMTRGPLAQFGGQDLFIRSEGFAAFLPNLTAVLAMSLIAPFYIAGGFFLYLARRTILEAWDIELNFKQMVTRKKTGMRLLSLLLCVAWLFSASAVFAPQAQASTIDKETAKQRIEKILESDDFGGEKTKTYWRLKSFDQSLEFENNFLEKFLTSLIRFISIAAKPIAWIAGGILFAFFLYAAARYSGFLNSAFRNKSFKPPDSLFGLSLTPESLPDDIAAAAKKHMEAGEARAALSLLYRGALSRLVYRFFLEIPASATEGQCIALVRKNRHNDEYRFFRELTETWLKTAYAHIKPDMGHVEALCLRWEDFYA